MKRKGRKGSTLLEFTLAGIPMIFVLISTFEVSRLVWNYHTLTSAVTESVRFAIVHGKNCNRSPNACAITVRDVAGQVQARAVGLAPQDLNLNLVSGAGTISCRLDQCLTNISTWPPAPANEPGMEIQVSATYAVDSMISMLWPGGGTVQPFGVIRIPASSREAIQF